MLNLGSRLNEQTGAPVLLRGNILGKRFVLLLKKKKHHLQTNIGSPAELLPIFHFLN